MPQYCCRSHGFRRSLTATFCLIVYSFILQNGLVGMVGSGMPETYELETLIRYILSVVSKYDRPVIIPSELGVLLDAITDALKDLKGHVDAENLNTTVPAPLFEYWDTVATAREDYRTSVKRGFSGNTTSLSPETLLPILRSWINEIDKGKARAFSFGSQGYHDNGLTGVPPTYFSYNVTKFHETGERNKDGHPLVSPKKMKVSRFPLFLEGPTRYMKTVNAGEAREMYERVRKSGLYDEGLKMYTISESLKGQVRPGTGCFPMLIVLYSYQFPLVAELRHGANACLCSWLARK